MQGWHRRTIWGNARRIPPNTPRIRHATFAVTDIEDVVARLGMREAELVGQLERYKDSYRLGYVHRPDGIIVELAEKIG